jgi:Leucine-rich repeat (LRR) protein
LSENNIQDLSPLGSLINLRRLYIAENGLTDISALSTLFKLTTLMLHDNEIVDINPISDMVYLSYLNLHHNQIDDISVFSDMLYRGGFQNAVFPGGIIIVHNKMDITKGTTNRDVVEELLKADVYIEWKWGNITEKE